MFSLDPKNVLGFCVGLKFRSLQFLLTPFVPLRLPLLPGQLLVATSSYRAGHILILRAQEINSLPEQGSREYQLCVKALSTISGDEDLLTQSIGMLQCEILGSFSLQQAAGFSPRFSSNQAIVAASNSYTLYQPDQQVMEMLINGTVNSEGRVELGFLRSGEDLEYLVNPHPAHISMVDIRGKRTAMFGKTRLGKSNVVKLILQGMLDFTSTNPHVGQIVFDVNGEYAYANPQDGNDAIAEAYRDRCISYFLSNLVSDSDARLLRFNFYERTEDVLEVIRELLPQEISDDPEIRNLLTVRLPSARRLEDEHEIQFQRRLRKLMLFWTILDSAGFESDSNRMKHWIAEMGVSLPFNPGFSQVLRRAAYLGISNIPAPSLPFDFYSMALEIRTVARFSIMYPNDPSLNQNGQYLFDADEEIMVKFLCQSVGFGTARLRPCLQFHSPVASDFTSEILSALDQSKTVIINLGSASEQIIRYFAKSICLSIFRHQERKFVNNCLKGHYVQIYFEEAHMIFPPNSGDVINIYSRFAKEGAKFNIGIAYCTQSPTTVNRDLLAQTENFFIGHLSSEAETSYLSTVQLAFKGCEREILRNRTPGFIQVLTHSHRYVVPIQAHRYCAKSRLVR